MKVCFLSFTFSFKPFFFKKQFSFFFSFLFFFFFFWNTLAWEEKLRRSENLLQERKKQLTEKGVVVDFAFDDSMLSSSQTSTHSYLTSLSPSLSSSPSIRLSQMLPSLVNLNEGSFLFFSFLFFSFLFSFFYSSIKIKMKDSHLSECLVYYLKPGKTKIGRGESNASPDIILSGLNIQNEHCEILNNDKNVKIIPYENSIVYVNGELIQKETELFQGDRVILGNNHIFRFTNPLQPIDEEKKKSLTVIDWNFAQKEFAQVQVTFFFISFSFLLQKFLIIKNKN